MSVFFFGEAREQFHSRMADKDELNSMYLYVSNCVTLRSWLTGWLVFTTRVQGPRFLNTSQVVHSWLDIHSCFSFAESGRYVFSLQPSDALCRKCLKLAHWRQPPELALDCENVSSAPLDGKILHMRRTFAYPCRFHVIWHSQDPDKFILDPTGMPCCEWSSC